MSFRPCVAAMLVAGALQGCLLPPLVKEPVAAEPALSSKPLATPPPPPADDPKSCVDQAVEPVVPSAEAEEPELAAELQRQIAASRVELRSCQRVPERSEELDLALRVDARGSVKAEILATSLAEKDVVACIEEQLARLSLPDGPARARPAYLHWTVGIEPNAPVRFAAAREPADWQARYPAGAPQPAQAPASGRLPPEVIRERVRASYGMFQSCYTAGLGRNPNLTGRVIFRFVIGMDGAIADMTIIENQLTDCQVTACVRAAFSKVSFPAPDGGIVTVQYPIVFEPSK